MLCEETCRKLDACCDNWRSKKSVFDLEELSYESSSKKHLSELQDALDDVFVKITKGTIEVKVSLSGNIVCFTVMVRAGDRDIDHSFLCSTESDKVNISREALTYQLFETIKSSLGRLLVGWRLDSRELVRLANYICLTETDMLQSPVYDVMQKVYRTITKERERFHQITTEYRNWVSTVTEAMIDTAAAWFKKVKFVPGMKIVFRNAESVQVEGTIKNVSKKHGTLVFELTDDERVSLDNSRFCRFSTWIANAMVYREIAQALRIQID